MTYNLVNLKIQNSLNIGHNANPTFSLMNNQSKFFFEDARGFILDTPKDMKLDFFGVDFWHLLCLSSIETSFTHLRIDRHSPSIPLFILYIAFLKVFLDGPQSMAFLVIVISQSLDFCSKLFFYPLILSVFSKYSSFAPSVGCDPGQGFFLKETHSGSNGDHNGYNL